MRKKPVKVKLQTVYLIDYHRYLEFQEGDKKRREGWRLEKKEERNHRRMIDEYLEISSSYNYDFESLL